MLFNSLTFAVFFAVVFSLHWLLPWHRARLGFLLAASWLFYAAWRPAYLGLLLGITGVAYLAALGVARYRVSRPGVATAITVCAAAGCLLNLAVFKYADFGFESVTTIASWLSGQTLAPRQLKLVLPLGISFFTFEVLAYVLDVRRGACPAERNPTRLALYVSFFARSIAGPIVRPNEFMPQLETRRTLSQEDFFTGLDWISLGLIKKVIFADQLARFVDYVFADVAGMGVLPLWLGIYAYAAQIYCDFSGYTDIGRGCAACLGFRLPSNFDHPYFAADIGEFWRRWHMTLGRWLRDYLFIPLGGSRHGEWMTYRNLVLTMLLGGLWHGASWCFVAWGLWHGLGMVAHRATHAHLEIPLDRPLLPGCLWRFTATCLTFHFVCFGWILFRSPTFQIAFDYLYGMGTRPLVGLEFAFGSWNLLVAAVCLIGLLGLHRAARGIEFGANHTSTAWILARPPAYAFATAAICLFAGQQSGAFIYFQF